MPEVLWLKRDGFPPIIVEADVLAYNAPMLAVFQRSGLPICRQREGNIIHVTLALRSAQVSEAKR
jgi:hypothetical protein